MKFTLSWLKDHLDTSASVEELAAALTGCGLEVEGIENPAERLSAFTIAHVLTAERHPQADKLQVLSVDTGSGDPMQVVCGAPNARAGMKGVFGAPGTYVPGSGITLKVAAIRGVESKGMMCSMRELELSDEHDGIIVLPDDAPVGARYVDWAGMNDPVFDIAITPNRQECLGVLGIARDLAAAGIGTLKARSIAPVAGSFPMPRPIKIEDTEGCPAFAGRVVRGVTNGPSPDWLQRRLRAVGLRPISALVDITNFLSINSGRPLHVYDVAKLSGGLTARRARAGESVLALNGKTYALDETMTVIADDAEVHDIGGIMGGEHSGCSETTTDVLIESAYFTPERIGTTGRALGINSDARARFERGVDPLFVAPGLELATQMVLDLCGGEASEMVVAGQIPDTSRSIAYRPSRVLGLAGLNVAEDEQADILTRLGFSVTKGDVWQVSVPSWRRDVDGEADLVEDVVRIHGLDKVPATPLPRAEGVALPTATPLQRTQRRLRRVLASRGLDEAITWSFLPPAHADAFGGAAYSLANPISADMAAMRPSLLPGLLSAATWIGAPHPCAYSNWASVISPMPNAQPPPSCWPVRHAAATGAPARPPSPTPMTPRPKPSPRSRQWARPCSASRSSPRRTAGGTPAAWAGWCWARCRSPISASSTRAFPPSSTRRGRLPPSNSISMHCRRAAASARPGRPARSCRSAAISPS